MCEYEFRSGERCKEEALPNSEYCILHVDLPEDEKSEEFKRINELKEEKVKEKVNKGDFNFEGAKLYKVDFSVMKIDHELSYKDLIIKCNFVIFVDAVIRTDAHFNEVEMGGSALFGGAEIGGNAWFDRAKIGGNAWFEGAKIGEAKVGGFAGVASFRGAEIGQNVLFDKAKIGGNAQFGEVKIGISALFGGVEIGGEANFNDAEIGMDAKFNDAKIGRNAFFSRAKIGLGAWFDFSEIKGELIFKKTKFRFPAAQEKACRKAKRICEDLGDRIEADYYFYREMEAKRKQKYKTFSLKPILKLIRKLRLEKLINKHVGFLEKERRIYWGFLELPIQYIFGYGVHPWRVIATWLLTVFSLAFVYWLGNGVEAAESLVEYIYFSVVTAATPGYGGYHPKPGFYQGLASFEAIFGTFMWAAFIATFARKYMR